RARARDQVHLEHGLGRAQLGAERAGLLGDLADLAAVEHRVLARFPVDHADRHRRPVEPARSEIRRGDRIVRQRALHFGAVGRELGRATDRTRHHAGRRAVQHPVEPQVAVVAGEADRDPVAPVNAPERRQRLERLAAEHPAHAASRISTSGTDGASPAANAAPVPSSRSLANRTGTSNRNPAGTPTPSPGASSNAIHPPGSSVQPPAGVPSSATITLSATGRVIGRTCGSGPSYRLHSRNRAVSPSPTPIGWSLASGAPVIACELKSNGSRSRNPRAAPRRARKNATRVPTSAADRIPGPPAKCSRASFQWLPRRSWPEAVVATEVENSALTPASRPSASG